MPIYVGVNNKAQEISDMYIGVNNKAQKISKIYVGVNNKAQLCYEAESSSGIIESYKVTYDSKTVSSISYTYNGETSSISSIGSFVPKGASLTIVSKQSTSSGGVVEMSTQDVVSPQLTSYSTKFYATNTNTDITALIGTKSNTTGTANISYTMPAYPCYFYTETTSSSSGGIIA